MGQLGFGLIFLAAVLWALIGVFTAEILDAGVGAMEIAFWRALLGGALFALHAALAGHWELKEKWDLGLFVIFGAFGVGLFFGAYNLAIEAGGISLAVVLLYTAPAFVVVLARIWLGEALSLTKIVAVALVVMGVAAVAFGGDSPGVSINPYSVGWGLLAGLGYASFYIWGKRLLRRYHPVTVYAFILPIGALVILPLVNFTEKSMMVWGLLAVLVVFSTYLAYLFYYMGLRHVEASRAVLVASLEPVMAATLAALFFDERLGAWAMVGGLMVVSASVIGVMDRRGVQKKPGKIADGG